ncbi:MAG: PAC2 family protein [Caldilineaceae bacterium]|nr:PAC2 family protein [Caldilineaceae bacterium]
MTDALKILKRPPAESVYMIAGWHQWADAGAVSSGLPYYLIHHLQAEKIAEVKADGFYLFQIPGTHHLLRPDVKFEEGYSKAIRPRENEFFYAGNEQKGLVIFLGEEPHMDIDRYADTLFAAMKEFNVKRTALVGGVYGAMPYEKDREVSCTYSLREMKEELSRYAVRFSNYEGGATIGSYIDSRAKLAALEVFVFNAFVPAYDFSQAGVSLQGLRIEDDYKAWYELMQRITHMFSLGIDLSDLDRQSEALVASMEQKLFPLEAKMPQLQLREYLTELTSDFKENPFEPLDELWERELSDLFDDQDEAS